jgi:hypothetical protein
VLKDSRMGCADVVEASFGEFVGNTVHDLLMRVA